MTAADDYRALDIDDASRTAFAARGLDVRLVPADADGFGRWQQVVARGFLDGERTPEQVAATAERSGYRRITGVFDPASPEPDSPVATIASWPARLGVPGGRDVEAVAVSAVTVAATHRRRGLARTMLEGELRAAVRRGAPLAMLTVSESTLYGRYGFAPAASSASWRIETRRAGWIGPRPEGRIDFVSRERLRELIAPLHERVRTRQAGEIDVPPGHWDSIARTRPDAKEPGALRALQYADAAGKVQGLALYSITENDDDDTKATAHVAYLLAATDDAYAALWRFLLEVDLVAEVRAGELSVDEPLRWMIADQRAAVETVQDHQYVRVLDPVASLESRRFGGPGSFLLEVGDDLGFAAGRWLLLIDQDGTGLVSAADELPENGLPADAVTARMGVQELSALYLGGVSATTLAAAGRIETTDAAALARAFSWHTAPRLSIWY